MIKYIFFKCISGRLCDCGGSQTKPNTQHETFFAMGYWHLFIEHNSLIIEIRVCSKIIEEAFWWKNSYLFSDFFKALGTRQLGPILSHNI